jgi:alkylated DNA repair dioxygenase AlkB
MLFQSCLETSANNLQNILPKDGEVYYFGKILEERLSHDYFEYLLNNIQWQNDRVVIYSKEIVTARKIAWFANGGESFEYSGKIRLASKWNNFLIHIKQQVEEISNFEFNSCLLNLYHSGDEGMSWHTDKTKEFSVSTTIATLSLGACRRFDFRHIQTKETVSLFLEAGSLMIMTGQTQNFWLHQVPKTKKVKDARISLTFRQLLKNV